MYNNLVPLVQLKWLLSRNLTNTIVLPVKSYIKIIGDLFQINENHLAAYLRLSEYPDDYLTCTLLQSFPEVLN